MARVQYILEFQKPGKDQKPESVILPYVSDISFEREHAEVTTWTLGDNPTHHYSGIREEAISISGRSGVATRFETRGATSVSAADKSGPALFRRLEKFLEKYETYQRDAMRQNTPPGKLAINMLFEQKKLQVVTESFSFRRSAASSRFSYEYDIRLKAYRRLQFESPRGPLDKLKSAFAVSNAITKGINEASTVVTRIAETLQDAKSQLDTFREPLRAMRRLGTQFGVLSSASNALVQWPKAAMLDFWFATFELTTAVFDEWANLPFTDRQAARSTMIEALADINAAKRASQTALGLNFITLPGKVSTYERQIGLESISSDRSYTSRQLAITALTQPSGGLSVLGGKLVQTYTVVAGDTLPDIAGRLIGDRSRWTEIADLNDMTGVNIFSDGSPLIGGMILFVPAPEGAQLPGLSPNDLYGVDLQLGPDGDFVGVGTDPQDIATIRGTDNLVQALTNRFVTVQEDNATFPDHGLPLLVGEQGTADSLAIAALEAQTQMQRDPRIKSVDELEIVDEGDRFVVSSSLQPVLGKAFNITIPFPSA